MKKMTLAIVAILGLQFAMIAQEENQTSLYDYNKWSIDVGAGVNKPLSPFADGAFTNTPDFLSADLGVRYMINEKFGFNLGLGYDQFEGDDQSTAFKSNLYSVTLEGVANAGNILGFREWTDRFNFLVHGGLGYSRFTPSEPVDVDFGNADQMLHLTVGLTPQIRLSDRITLFADASLTGNVRQNLNFDGTTIADDTRGFNGYFVTTTAGISISLGKNEVHADWYSKSNADLDRINELEERLAKVETDLIDTDQDGVPDYLDREPNTISGVAVDTKGIAVDKNENGIPDELESSLDARYAKKGDMMNNSSVNSGGDVIKKLIEDGYVNVYFQFNSAKPETYSLEAINYLIRYMNENPGASAQLIGYADEIGNPSYNQALSERRAQMVKDIMVASGVNASRLTTNGNGEDTSVDKGSAPARQLVRRVTFKLN